MSSDITNPGLHASSRQRGNGRARHFETPVPGGGNGRRNKLGVATVLGIAVAGIAVLAWFGVPTPGELYTEAKAEAAHGVLHERISAERQAREASIDKVLGEMREERRETSRKLEGIDLKVWELVKKAREK